MISVGVDPGFTNLGLAIKQNDSIYSKKINPEEKGLIATVNYLTDFPILVSDTKRIVVIERYVAYAGANNARSENILMLIGALEYAFTSKGFDVRLIRAIDWKINLCKHLVKTSDFQNPSQKLDKKFSLAAAKHIAGGDIPTDHEADAICLAKYGELVSTGVL